MNNNKEKKNFTQLISVWCAAVCSICCVGLVIGQNFCSGGILTIDVFFGTGIALIGICATFIAGLQIWNHIEFREIRDRIKYLDKIETDIIQDKEDIVKNERKNAKHIGNIFLSLARMTDENDSEILYRAFSITCDVWYLGDNEHNKISSELMLERYIRLNKVFKDKCKLSYLRILKTHFEELDIPREYPDYQQILKLHFKIVEKIDEIIKQNDK